MKLKSENSLGTLERCSPSFGAISVTQLNALVWVFFSAILLNAL